MNQANDDLVYIIILNWRNWEDTVCCIKSLLELNYQNYRIVVVDNASSDESISKIKEYLQKNEQQKQNNDWCFAQIDTPADLESLTESPQITLLETTQNLGFSGGNNIGLKLALKFGARFAWILNNDTVVDPTALSELIIHSKQFPSQGLIGSVLYYQDQPDKIQAIGGGWLNLLFGTSKHCKTLSPEKDLDYVTFASVLIRQEVLNDVGLMDDNFFMYWEDADYCLRAKKKNWKIGVCQTTKIYHAEGGSLKKNNAKRDFYFTQSLVRFLKLYAPHPKSTLMLNLVIRLSRRIMRGDIQSLMSILNAVKSINTRT